MHCYKMNEHLSPKNEIQEANLPQSTGRILTLCISLFGLKRSWRMLYAG